MKSYYVKAHHAFVRYFDIPAVSGHEALPTRIFLSGLSTPATAGLLDVAMHPAVRGRRSLLIDTIGSGFSDKSSTFDHTMPHHAHYIANILDHEGLSGCEFIGHSMGGTIALYIALQRPDLVSQLVLAESNLAAGGGPGTRYIASFTESDWINGEHAQYMANLNAKAREGNAGATFVAGAWEASDPYGVYHQSKSLVNLPTDFMQQIATIHQPITFIYGDANLPENNNGEIWPDSPEPETLTAVGIKVGIVENSGHMMMVDNLDGFAQVVAKALKTDEI
ncbi:MAG: alpha/beta hydrolase [Chloroflexota bacterium]